MFKQFHMLINFTEQPQINIIRRYDHGYDTIHRFFKLFRDCLCCHLAGTTF